MQIEQHQIDYTIMSDCDVHRTDQTRQVQRLLVLNVSYHQISGNLRGNLDFLQMSRKPYHQLHFPIASDELDLLVLNDHRYELVHEGSLLTHYL